MELLDIIKIKLNINNNNSDILLNVLIDEAEEELKEVTNLEEIPSSLTQKVVILKYNRIGSEGLNSESYSGASQSFINGYPKEIQKQINSIRRLV